MLFPFVRSSTLSGAVAMPFVLLLAACATQPAPPAEAEALPPPPAVPRVMPVEAEPKAPATQPASLFTLMTQGPAAAMLAYADKVRPLGGAELAAEITRAGDPGDSPTAQMQLALLLAQTRVPADLARALGLMQRVISNPRPRRSRCSRWRAHWPRATWSSAASRTTATSRRSRCAKASAASTS